MVIARNEEERQYRKLSKTLADFPWLFGIKCEWMYGIDDVAVTDRLTDLRAMLLSPARNDGARLWVYREFVMPLRKFPVSSGVALVPHADGKRLWAKQVMETTSSCARIGFMALKLPHDHDHTIYRVKKGDFNEWVERLAVHHPYYGQA